MKNGPHVDEDDTIRWYLNDKLHREDGPAVEHADGTKFWYRYNKLYREDGPTEEWSSGTVDWRFNGRYLGEDAEGFWAHWEQLTHTQRCNLNLHFWLAKYT
jgi:hypothetical protein